MNLLKKIALVAMTVLMGTGVAIGVGNTLETVVPSDQVAHAADSSYCFVGSATGWSNGAGMTIPSGSSDKGVLLNFKVNAGDTFKIKQKANWDNALGWSKLDAYSPAKVAFESANKDDNIKVKYGGYFNIYVNISTKIYIDFGDSQKVEVFYQNNYSGQSTYIYAFDESTGTGNAATPTLGGWPGSKTNDFTNSSSFNGNLGGIGRAFVPFLNKNKLKIILNNGNGNGKQTSDLTYSDNKFYKNDSSILDANVYEQAKLVFDIDIAIEKATDKSVCEISQSVAKGFVDRYNALADKTYINKSTINTLDHAQDGKKKDYTYEDVRISLSKVAQGIYKTNLFIWEDRNINGNHLILLSVVCVFTVAGSIILIRRRSKKDY